MKPIIQHTWQIQDLQRGASAVVVPIRFPMGMKPRAIAGEVRWLESNDYPEVYAAGGVWLRVPVPFSAGDVLLPKESWRVRGWPGYAEDADEILIEYRDGQTARIDMKAGFAAPSPDFDNWIERIIDDCCWEFDRAGVPVDPDSEEYDLENWPGEGFPTRWRPANQMPLWCIRPKFRAGLTVSDQPQALRYDEVSEEQAEALGYRGEPEVPFSVTWESSHPDKPWLWYVPIEPLTL